MTDKPLFAKPVIIDVRRRFTHLAFGKHFNMILYNRSAFFAKVIGLVCGFAMYSFSKNVNVAAFFGALGVIAFDVMTRLGNNDEEMPLIAPDAGAHSGLFQSGSLESS